MEGSLAAMSDCAPPSPMMATERATSAIVDSRRQITRTLRNDGCPAAGMKILPLRFMRLERF